MANRSDTRRSTVDALKRLEKKGVRSVYLEGKDVSSITPARALTPARAGASPKDAEPLKATKAGKAPSPANQSAAVAAGDELAELSKIVSVCTKCALHETRTQTVFGTGHPNAKLMFIGEAPGADEDARGEPFVGRAGQLLTKIIVAMGMTREEVYIGNILKCRPPKNRDPQPSEVECCEEYLKAQIALIQPKYICALGRIAAHWLLKTDAPLGALRTQQHTYQGIPVVVTYHPAALLRNPAFKAPCWEDMKKLMALLKDT
jgi:DNA polymerase